MKKALLIIGLLLTVTLVNSYNYPSQYTGKKKDVLIILKL